jgi:hypothetical protein
MAPAPVSEVVTAAVRNPASVSLPVTSTAAQGGQETAIVGR